TRWRRGARGCLLASGGAGRGPGRVHCRWRLLRQQGGGGALMTETEYRDRYRWLCRALAGRYPGADPDLIHDAVTDALLDHWRRPERYGPARASELGYLRMAAWRNLLNLLTATRPRPLPGLVLPRTAPSAEQVALARLAACERVHWLLRQTRDDAERAVLLAWLTGGYYGRGRQVGATPAVKRAADRLAKRIRRRAGECPC